MATARQKFRFFTYFQPEFQDLHHLNYLGGGGGGGRGVETRGYDKRIVGETSNSFKGLIFAKFLNSDAD